jgi:hypothetical protein
MLNVTFSSAFFCAVVEVQALDLDRRRLRGIDHALVRSGAAGSRDHWRRQLDFTLRRCLGDHRHQRPT